MAFIMVAVVILTSISIILTLMSYIKTNEDIINTWAYFDRKNKELRELITRASGIDTEIDIKEALKEIRDIEAREAQKELNEIDRAIAEENNDRHRQD